MGYDIRPIGYKWFKEDLPANYTKTSATLGAGTNGTITVTVDDITCDTEIEIVLAAENSKPLAVAVADGVMTVTLGTNAGGTADDTKNTAKLIAEKINTVVGYNATHSGTGATAISTETSSNVKFDDGNYGTPSGEAGICLYSNGYYYVSTEANNTIYNTSWKKFQLVDL